MASYEQNANREWSVRFRYVEFGKMKNKRLSCFNTKKDAEKAYIDYIKTHNQSKVSQNKDITFEQLYNNYFEYIRNKLKVSSVYDISHIFSKHLLPVFGKMKVFKITKRDIFDWQNKLNKTDYSYKFKCKLRGDMSAIFRYAVFYYDLPANPVSQVEPFKRTETKKEMQVWTLDEFKKFISCVENEPYKTFFMFLYLTGCRKGEAFALTWDKVDFKNKTVTINQNLTRKVDGKPFEITSTKTNNSRSILIPETLVSQLSQLLNTQPNNHNYKFVFGGNYPLADRTTTRVFENAIKKAGVKPIHLHCLRHSHASYLISQGENIVMVSKRLGHATIQQTLNTYSHLMPNQEQQMVSKLELKFDD